MKVGVIGVGAMGKNHARVYSEMKGVDSLYLFDITPEVSARTANEIKKCRTYICRTASSLLEWVDLVSICVPTQHHYHYCQEALEYEVPFLVEKPMCGNLIEAASLVKQSKEGNLITGVGHIERFNPIVEEIKNISHKPLYLEIKRHNPTSARNTTSVVDDLMIHDIDILFNSLDTLLDPDPEKKYTLHSTGNDCICSALFTFNCFHAYLTASKKSSKKIRSIYIEEEEFTIEGNYMTQEIYIHKKPEHYSIEKGKYLQENIVEKVMVNKQEPLKVELSTFVDCVKNGRKFPISLDEGFKNMCICEEIKAGL